MKKLITSSNALWSCLIAMAMFVTSMSVRAEYVPLTLVYGVDAFSGGGEGPSSLIDEDTSSKWGCWFNPDLADENAWPTNPNESANKCYIIVKAATKVVPTYYFLVTGNDSKDSGRNWLEWKVYGGNFDSDEAAVRDAAGWVLVDDHTTEDDPLPNDNFAPKNFECSEEVTDAFQYYWIEVISTEAQADVYQQMGEWGLGTYNQFQSYLENKPKPDTDTDQPVIYYVLEGTKMTGGENLPLLFDGKVDTKWGNGFTNRQEGETENGAYFIVKASRSMLPTYYILTTANDTKSYSGRNWKQWQIYGMNAASDEAVKRNSEEWVALDKKYNVGTDQLPAENFTSAYFSLSEANETEYRYFKVEIDQIVANGDYMQMAEFNLGDEYTLAIDRGNVVKKAQDNYDPDVFAEKALLDQFEAFIASVSALTDASKLGEVNKQLDNLITAINVSANNYAELITVRNQAILALDGGTLTDEGIAYITAWVSETDAVAPGAEYPCGNFAYIKANRQLTGEEAVAESKRISTYLFNHIADLGDGIYATYERIDGSGGFGGEDDSMLYDGDREDTKWCTNTLPAWTVFKASDPIQPTYYGLVTGGDTYSYPGRNWKTWKIWGANLTDEEVEQGGTRNSDKWVLIDSKENVGTDILKTDNKFESYIYLSEGCAEPYQYFKIEVTAAGSGDLIQMNEFTFYNNANFSDYREGFVEQFSDYDPLENVTYKGYVDDFFEKYEEMQTTTYAPDLMKIKNELTDLQTKISSATVLYEKYDSLCVELDNLGFDSQTLTTWWNGYNSEKVGPSSKYIRGTKNYIVDVDPEYDVKLGYITEDELQAEFDYLQWIYNAADENNNCSYILLGGNTVGQFGDGFYGHLIDGIDKDIYDWDSPIDESTGKPSVLLTRGTKWGGNASETGETYIIFRTLDPTNPFFYTLTTGNDAATYTGRNWGSWFIYGANFEGDADATKDAEGWELIDNKENTGQDRLHPVNEEPSYFGFSTETEKSYLYYKVVVTKAYNGTQIQMNELHFGTPEEFEVIKDEYTANAQEFNYDVVAQQELIDDYVATIPEIDDCKNMEALFRVNYKLETLRDAITASAALYAEFAAKFEENKNLVATSGMTPSEALTFFQEYLNADGTVGPSDDYPNGSPAYIIENHVDNDSILRAELEFMESLKVAAVGAGYVPGMDITCLIVNPTFAKAGAMLKDEQDINIGREAEGWNGYIYRTANAKGEIYAAEFCNENAKFDVNQTLTNLQNGYYKVTLNAGFRANGELLSYNYAAMAYANDMATYVPVVREFAVDSLESWQGATPDHKVYYNHPDSTEYGWGIWGCEGAAHAFEQGRYAITMVAKVTDGTLTIGVKNEGTQGDEWTAVGNFGLVYLGAEATSEALQEASASNSDRISVLTDYDPDIYDPSEPTFFYVPCDPYENDDLYSLSPGFSAAQKNILKANQTAQTYDALLLVGETMKSIYETKQAYFNLKQASDKVYDHWFDFVSDQETFEDAIYAVMDGLTEGTFDDAEAAMAAKAELYAQYPDYLQYVGGSKVQWEQEDFAFDINVTGRNAYMEFANLYEPLEANEVILAFDYISENALENGRMSYLAPEWDPNPEETLSTIPAASDWTTAYVNVTKGIKDRKFGTAINHGIRWYFSGSATAEDFFDVQARNFRFITKAQMVAEGGNPLNAEAGDLNSDGKIDIADAVTILNIMASSEYNKAADLNGDGKVDIADFVTVLNMMAAQ